MASHVVPTLSWHGDSGGLQSRDPDYADLQVNRAEALRIWPSANKSRDEEAVFIEEAAHLIYEAMERVGLDDMTEARYSSPAVILNHYKYVLLTAAKEKAITLHGVRPPSRQSRPIPPDVMSQLQPHEGSNSLLSLSRASALDFRDVWLSRGDLDRAIEDRIALLERVNRGLAR